MAPKRKKKLAANPARGYATTSTASKIKTQVDDDDTSQNSSTSRTPQEQRQIPQSEPPATERASPLDNRNSLAELSPEELEQRLEDADLQNFTENFATQTHKDSSRQVNKLQTDCRLLRGQAHNLQCQFLLPQKHVSKLLGLIVEDLDHGRTESTTTSTHILATGDDLISKLWKLQQTLSSLGFHSEDTEKALKYVLRFPPHQEGDRTQVWGLEICVDWLAVNVSEPDLPLYDRNTGKLLKPEAAQHQIRKSLS